MTITRSVTAIFLVICAFTMAPSSSWAQATVKSSSKEKPLVLQFPNDASSGVIIKLPKDWTLASKKLSGAKFADAKGKVELPLHESFMLVPNYNCISHPEVLSGLPADSFATLTLDRIEAEDRVMPYICKLTGLKRLDVFDTELSDKGLENLGLLPNLQCLQLHEGVITGSFLAHNTQLKKLKYLWLSGVKIDTKFLDRYSSVLPNVKVIHLSGDQLEDQDLLFLRKFPHLEELHIDRNKQLTDKGLQSLLPCKELGFLNLDNTAVTVNGVKQLASIKVKRLLVPKRFSKSEVALLQKAMKDTVVDQAGSTDNDAYKLFAPLH